MKKILVTGCLGRIGFRLCKRLEPSYQIVGIDNDRPKTSELPFDFFNVDLSSQKSVEKAFEDIFAKHGREFEAVIHLAAYYSFKGEGYEPYKKITVDGTKFLAEKLTEAKLHQFIFSSTLLIYSPCKKGEKIKEGSTIDPNWEYPRSKVEAENILLSFKDNFPIVILRIAGCYDEMCHSIPIANQIERIYKKSIKSHLYPGHFQSGAPYLHFDDLIDVFAIILDKGKSLDNVEIFLLGEEETLTHEEIQTIIGKNLWNKAWITIKIPKWLAKVGAFIQLKTPFVKKPFVRPWMIDLTDEYYALDISKSKNFLSWEPKHRLSETLPIIIQNLKNDPEKWHKENELKQ